MDFCASRIPGQRTRPPRLAYRREPAFLDKPQTHGRQRGRRRRQQSRGECGWRVSAASVKTTAAAIINHCYWSTSPAIAALRHHVPIFTTPAFSISTGTHRLKPERKPCLKDTYLPFIPVGRPSMGIGRYLPTDLRGEVIRRDTPARLLTHRTR